MDAAGKAMRQRIRQLCTVQFGHTIMVKWSAQDKDIAVFIIFVVLLIGTGEQLLLVVLVHTYTCPVSSRIPIWN